MVLIVDGVEKRERTNKKLAQINLEKTRRI